MTEFEYEKPVRATDPVAAERSSDPESAVAEDEVSAVKEDITAESEASPELDSVPVYDASSPLDHDLDGQAELGPGLDGGGESPSKEDTPDAGFDPAELTAQLTALNERITESQRLLVRQSEFADKLHADNQRLRSGELRGAILPLVRDLLRLHDDIAGVVGASGRSDDLELVRVSLLEALARNGVVTMRANLGEPFDPGRHSAAGVVETDSAESDRCIAEVSRVGFEWEDGHAIRVAEVGVYRCVSASLPREQTTDPDGASGPG